jgi:hypothetical protein
VTYRKSYWRGTIFFIEECSTTSRSEKIKFGRRLASGNSPEVPYKYVDFIGQKAGDPCPPFIPKSIFLLRKFAHMPKKHYLCREK